MLFSQMRLLPLAIARDDADRTVHQDVERRHLCGGSLRQRKALGAVAGIVGAGGNVGSVLAGFLFKGSMPWTQALFVLGAIDRRDFSVLSSWFASPRRRNNPREREIEARLSGELAASGGDGRLT